MRLQNFADGFGIKNLGRKKVSRVSWVLYDFANTIFSMNVVSLHFALWVTQDHGGRDLDYSLVYAASVLAVLLLAPMLGRRADLKMKRRFFLIFLTLACVVATMLIGIINKLAWGFAFFFVANVSFQLALVLYDSLLPSVASEKEYGRVSGLGVAWGYAGAIAGIILVGPFVEVNGEVFRHHAFVPTALLFLIFAFPCFLFVRESQASKQESRGIPFFEAWKLMRRYAGVPTYLLAMFFLQNAVNTVILFMSVYAVRVGRLGQSDLEIFFIMTTCVAVMAAYLQGKWVDRVGPHKVLGFVIGVWILGLFMALAGSLRPVLWIAGCLIGTGLGGLWTVSRPLLLSLISNEESATFFGLNIFAGRFAALLGPMVWGVIVWGLAPLGILRYQIALGALIIFVFLGAFFAGRIPKKDSVGG